jgi:two-component system, OmpR family, sensor histidine kinase KdpD
MSIKPQWRRDAIVAIGGVGAIAAIIVVLRAVQPHPNPTIAALLFLLVVLAAATSAHVRVSLGLSVLAMLAFNFFLLAPLYTLTIADPQNWVALFVFVIVAVIASQLSAAVRQRASEAEARRQEVTRLFDLSRDILLTTDSERAMDDVARYVSRRFELRTIAICLPTTTGWAVHQGGERAVEPSGEQLDHALARMRGPLEYDARQRAYGGHVVVGQPGQIETTLVPLRLGTKAVGLLATQNPQLDLGTLDALGGVVAIAIERAQFLAEQQKAVTLRQRADLASALLAAFSHDLRTPVTSVRVAVANMQNTDLASDERRAQAQLAVEELDRLTRLFQDILDMARIDAAAVNPDRQWVSPADIVDAAIAYAGPALSDHTLEVDADGLNEIRIDPRLTSSALAHVLENAARYSAPGAPIAVRAWAEGEGAHFVVRDHGPGIDGSDLAHLFEPFYRGQKTRHATGTGLGLAISRGLLAAEGGRIWYENVKGGGAQFTIMVPSPLRVPDAHVS